MEHILIFSLFLLILIFTDLVGAFKCKNARLLALYLPIYAAALIINIALGLSPKFISVTALLEKLLRFLG